MIEIIGPLAGGLGRTVASWASCLGRAIWERRVETTGFLGDWHSFWLDTQSRVLRMELITINRIAIQSVFGKTTEVDIGDRLSLMADSECAVEGAVEQDFVTLRWNRTSRAKRVYPVDAGAYFLHKCIAANRPIYVGRAVGIHRNAEYHAEHFLVRPDVIVTLADLKTVHSPMLSASSHLWEAVAKAERLGTRRLTTR
jgi:hypothetical protein